MAEKRKEIKIGSLENLRTLQLLGVNLSDPDAVEDAIGVLPEGGIQKTRKSSKDPEAEPQNKGKEKDGGKRTPPPPPPTPIVLIQEKMKKEEPKVIQTQNTPTRVEPLYCPVCPVDDQPKLRRKATDIICGDCYRRYSDGAAIALAKGGQFQNVFEWVASKAPQILTTLEGQHVTAKAEVETLQKRIGDETFAALKRNTGGREVPREIWNQAFRQKKQEAWRSLGGNVKYARMKGLEGRIALLREIIEKAKNPPPPKPTATAAVTPQTEPAATTTEITPVAQTETAPTAEVTTPAKPPKVPRKRVAKTTTKK